MTQAKIVNDFSITVGTSNGSGSQTSNTAIMRALFKMGIPVSGKNLFPSNIQGLPTWYTIRVNKDGFIARSGTTEIMIAMNPTSFARDLEAVVSGGVFLYADDIKMPITREDVFAYPMPVKQIVRADAAIPQNLRDMIANMVYVGVLAQLINIDLDKVYEALDTHFKGKKKAIDLNFNVVKASAEWAAANLEKKDPYYVEALDMSGGKIMVDGNTAAALGAVYGGVEFVGWYPITPASSLAESLNEFLPQLRKDEDGKNTFAIVQAEDELSAIGMSIGAGWAGLRSMTSTSGPGLSLMTEFVGLAYFTEVPVVIWNVQRIGPSTGLPTRTAQGDLSFTYFISHGDSDSIILLPGSVSECFEFGWKAFDIAERMQMPVHVMIDLDFGMNVWVTDAFKYPEAPIDRGKVLWEEDVERLKNEWGRYLDKDGDGIPWRTVPGNQHTSSAYFLRGTGHDPYAKYSEDATNWAANMDRLKRKYKTAVQYVPAPEIRRMDGAKVGIIAFGSTEPAVEETRHLLNQEKGIKTDFLFLKAIPFNEDVTRFIEEHDHVYVVEVNRDGQLAQILTVNYPGMATKLRSVAHSDGLPPTASWVKEAILEKEAK